MVLHKHSLGCPSAGRRPGAAPSGSLSAQWPVALALLVVLLVPAAAQAQNFGPVRDTDFRDGGNPDTALVELGRLLFFDKILSGNRNISCASCHHPLTGTSDELSLPVGEGGEGLGILRTTGSGAASVPARVPRNAPALFNLGAVQFRRMFHDGRVEVDPSEPSGFRTPAGDDLPLGLDSALAAQAMFPITSGTEMAGQEGENAVANAAARGNLAGSGGVWNRLARRLRQIPEYVDLFRAAFDDVERRRDITMVRAANAIAAFEEAAWRTDNSPFDRFLRGEPGALSVAADRGRRLFYSQNVGCARCHAGPFQSDQRFHSIAMPQIGPGRGDGPDGHDDFGREQATGDPADRFRFRTPSLRNVELTGPWGHDGAYATLEAIVRHYRDPRQELQRYDQSQAILPSRPDLDVYDFIVMNDPARVNAIAQSNQARPVNLNDQQIQDLVAFLRALTDPRARDLSGDIPARVPSGLSVQE